MGRSRRNKENIAPQARDERPVDIKPERQEAQDVENNDGFVEVSLGSASNQIEQNLSSASNCTTPKTANKGKGSDDIAQEEDAEMAEGDLDGLCNMESSGDLDNVELEELLEIEQQIPDDLGPLDSPVRPHTPLGGQSSRSQPLSEIDPKDLPAPLNVNKSSYFSKDNPMEAEPLFEEIPDDTEAWYEEGEVDEDGIRREEAELSLAEWNLERHPRFGAYRVKEISCLRVCWTIDD